MGPRALALAVLFGHLCLPVIGFAQGLSAGEDDPSKAPPADETDALADEDRARLMVKGGVGLLALPLAEVCPTVGGECEPGETGIALNLHTLGRLDDFAFGAGILWAAGLRNSEAADPTGGTLGRQHHRRYLVIEGDFRYYPVEFGDWEAWVGASSGLVIINDSFDTLADRDPPHDAVFVGPRSVTLATPGLSVAVGAGLDWHFARRWFFGAEVRYANWVFAGERAQTPVGDLASFAGRVDVVDVGLIAGFLVPL
jgi:hypothetical protein